VGDKIFSHISLCTIYLKELDLSEIIEKDHDRGVDAEGAAIYDLQSIVIHKGEYGSGMYTYHFCNGIA